MPATARALKLAARPQDERLQPEKNARAAAQYLRYLHSRFGDWRLALAAYNAGETRVDNLLKQHKARDFDAIAQRLPAETQMFVPKVEATLRKREGRSLADLKQRNA
jgi:membrane-bound lytic murein transglycosylase D